MFLRFAMSDPFNVIAQDQVRALLGRDVDIRPLLAGQTEVDKAIDQFLWVLSYPWTEYCRKLKPVKSITRASKARPVSTVSP